MVLLQYLIFNYKTIFDIYIYCHILIIQQYDVTWSNTEKYSAFIVSFVFLTVFPKVTGILFRCSIPRKYYNFTDHYITLHKLPEKQLLLLCCTETIITAIFLL